MEVIDAHRVRSKAGYRCPACRGWLERRVSSGERMLVLVGCAALLVASGLSILDRAGAVQAPHGGLAVLYVLAAVVGLVEVRNELVRRRFHVAPEP